MENRSDTDDENTTDSGRGFWSEIAPHSRHTGRPITPGKTALLVVDMQDYFLHPQSGAFMENAPAIVPHVKALQDAFLERGLPVVATRHRNTAEDAGMMAVWWRELISPEDPHVGIIEELRDRRVLLLDKAQYDAFYGTGLQIILEERGVSQMVVCGIKTHLCCDTTARSAFVRGFEVFFCVDATASDNRELHVAALKNLSNGFAVPVLTREILATLGDK